LNQQQQYKIPNTGGNYKRRSNETEINRVGKREDKRKCFDAKNQREMKKREGLGKIPLWNGGGTQGNLLGEDHSPWALGSETCIR